MVHCSDGWDRTPTLLSIVQILIDPHYRTFNGFNELIHKDWIMYGHPFALRRGIGNQIDKN